MSKAKGGRTRRKIQKWFEAQGYLVANVERGGRFVTEKDLFALGLDGDYSDKGFDLIALGSGVLAFIQCKTNSKATQSYYKDFSVKYCNDVIECVVATWVSYDGLYLQYYEPDGSVTEIFKDSKEVNELIKEHE